MNIKEIVTKTRSVRRFNQAFNIERKTLVEIVDTARLTASARNMQPLKYKVVYTPDECQKVFDTLAWAGYLENGAPKEGEQPSAYIIICNDDTLATESKWDQGIVSQTMMMASTERGLGGCIIASIKRAELCEALHIASDLTPVIVLALGKPIEDVRLCNVENGNIRYFRNHDQVHFVPKRSLEEVLLP